MEARRGRPPYPGLLTPAEERVLDLVRTGLTNAEIAVRLGLSISTVRYHLTNLHAKANSESREALRSWRPDARPNLLGVPLLLPGLKALGLAAVVAGIGVAAATAFAFLANREGSPGAEVPPVEMAASEQDPPELGEDRVTSVPTIAVVVWDGGSPTIRLVDSQTGAEVALTTTGYNPVVTFRRSANELLVLHEAGSDASIREAHVVDVLDLSSSLALKRRIAAPDLTLYKVYHPYRQLLSDDERYLAVSTMTMRDEIPECASRQLDGPSCARHGVRILDLESEGAWWFELPRFCGAGTFHRYEDSGFAVTCSGGGVGTTGYVSTAGSGGSITFVERPLPGSHWPVGNVLPVYGQNGWFGALSTLGSYFTWTRPGSDQIRFDAVPGENIVRWPIYAEVGGGKLVIGYVPTTGDQYPDGLAVFSMVDGVIERELPSYDISRSMVASGPDTLVATTTDGRLIEITVSSGAVRELGALGVDPENVALVR